MDSTVKEQVERRAYELFIERGGEHGYAMEDWAKAEKEITGAGMKKKTVKSRKKTASV